MDNIDEEKAKSFFYDIYWDWDRSYADDIASESSDEYTNRLTEEMFEHGLITESEAKDDNFYYEDIIEEFVEELVQDKLDEGNNGFDYYLYNFGDKDAYILLIDNNLIDIDEMSEEAVGIDGIGHFINSYDGEYYITPSDYVYIREN